MDANYIAYYGVGGKVGFDVGATKAFVGVHIYTVQRELNYKGIEKKYIYSGLEGGIGPVSAGFKFDWINYDFSAEASLGPVNWSTGEFPVFSLGGDFYIFFGVGGRIDENAGKVINHYIHMNDWMGLPAGTPKF